MIIVIGPDATEAQKKAIRDKIIELDYTPHEIQGVERQVIGAVGEDHGKEHLMEVLSSMAGVESVIPILKSTSCWKKLPKSPTWLKPPHCMKRPTTPSRNWCP